MTGRRAVLVALVVGGCASSSFDSQPALDSALRIETTGCGSGARDAMGTALDDRLVVTAAHGLAGATEVRVIDADGAVTDAQVVLFDPLLDVAALRTEVTVASPAAVRDDVARAEESGGVAVADDDGVITVLDVEIVRRATIRTTDIYRNADVERPGFEIDATIEQGDSGTAVHLPGGVVGLVWARSTIDDRRAWAVDLPAVLTDPERRAALVTPVDNGTCP
jgi:S1-C subfamily serine protease